MKRQVLALLVAAPFVAALTACPNDEKGRDSVPVVARVDTVDTTQTDLGQIQTALPPAEPDTFKRRKLPTGGSGGGGASIPAAPAALMEAVQREQSFSRFCYTEFGQKSDPTLRGNVAMVVTVGANGITGAAVGDDNWTGAAGRAVNNCLNQRAKSAWKLAPGAVRPGRYVVQLSFTGA